MSKDPKRSELTDRPNKRRAGSVAGGLSVADPRPRVIDGRLRGARCTVCGLVTSQPDIPWCADCFGAVEPAGFEPVGTVWAATTVRLPVGRWRAPFGLGYVDVIDGPRVLVHVPGAEALPKRGDRVEFTTSDDGDLVDRKLPEGAVK